MEPQKSPVAFSKMRPLGNPSPTLIKMLSEQMENFIVEANVRKDEVGPLRAAWETALKRWRKSKSVPSSIEKVNESSPPEPSTPIDQDDEAGKLVTT